MADRLLEQELAASCTKERGDTTLCRWKCLWGAWKVEHRQSPLPLSRASVAECPLVTARSADRWHAPV